MPITAIAAIVLGLQQQRPPLYCPATLEKLVAKSPIDVEYGGILFGTCCVGCGNPLVRDPKPLLVEAIKERRTVGVFLYDPVSGLRINGAKAPEYMDYKAIRYFFNSKEEKKQFDLNPDAYVTPITSEAYYCPVAKQTTEWSTAAGFADFHGVRYFVSSPENLKAFKADPAKYADGAASAVKPLAAVVVKRA